MKVGMFIGKVKKFGISWCIPHRMAADNAKGGSMRTPLYGIGLTYFFYTKMSKTLHQAKLGSVVLVSDIAKNHNTQINYQDVIPRI